MSQTDTAKDKPYDPMDALRGMRDAYMGAMAKTMAETVNTEAYAQATGTMLNQYLTATGPAKEALDRSMLQMLEQMSLPSRSDVQSLAERFTNIEMRIDDMDAKLDELLRLAKTAPPVQATAREAVPEPAATPVPDATAAPNAAPQAEKSPKSGKFTRPPVAAGKRR